MTLQTIRFEHVPVTHAVHVGLFRNVKNAAHLQSQLISRNADFEYAFIDASVVRLSQVSESVLWAEQNTD